MRFVTYERGDERRLGVVADDDRIVDLARAAAAAGAADPPGTMLELIARGEAALELGRAALADPPDDAVVEGATIVAPIPRPAKNVFAVGLNYVAHNAEFTGGKDLPSHPIVFTKAPNAVVGPGVPIRSRPDLTPQLDYEGELGVVIGRAGSDIAPEDAEAHIFGYVIVNDVTARDLQKRTSQWFLGKSLDTFCPMGPWLVHKSEIGWPVELDITTRINGEVRQDANTRDLYFDIPTLIATVSAGITLEPGDVIATGTPEGVGMGFSPPRFLRAGDVVEIEIEKLGRLRNPVA